ncbi:MULTISPECIES: hypothetical protein [unclassified Virgibacillus]|uniref:hypothetical protein n=1 Tax=unclassified Virgibacillus TaxID=2620237 RepID=UPI00090C28A8|nr:MULTISPECIES: hypothetical protein [unclassified Virgibacillus]API93997.1 hypothetical protein BKP57_20505 [Virgibacillus sp. 6R]MBS7427447.1 hypothetical protein [Virgibacillus sp. 19R1-5]
MKRTLLLLLIGLLTFALVACSDDKGNETKVKKEESTQEEDKEDNSKSEDDMSQAEWTEKNHPEKMPSTDPLEVGNKNNDKNIFQDGATTITIVGRYVGDQTDEDGFNTIEYKDTKLRFALVIVEGEEGDQEVGMFGEKINNGDTLMDYDDTISITTDQKEKGYTWFQLNGPIDPGLKEKFFDSFDLQYDIPETLTFTMRKPVENEEEYLMNENERKVIAEIEFEKE